MSDDREGRGDVLVDGRQRLGASTRTVLTMMIKELLQHSECYGESRPTSIEKAKNKLNIDLLLNSQLREVDCGFQLVQAHQRERSLETVVKQTRALHRAKSVIVYAVRNPGCNLCRETGKLLSDMVKKDRSLHLISIVKEIGKADNALLEYFSDYGQRNPIYLDANWEVYRAMGGRKISPFIVAWRILGSLARTAKMNIYANVDTMKTDFWTQGGLFFFDKKARLAYTIYEPAFGDEIDSEEIREAILKCRFGFNAFVSHETWV